ncbi:MAG: hypothetical protein WBQ18_06080 [Solirubrobacteraceae bacterium]
MHSLRLRFLVAAVAAGLLALMGTGLATARGQHGHRGLHGAAARQVRLRQILRTRARSGGRQAHASSINSQGADTDLADSTAQYLYERTAPAAAVNGPAMLSAADQAGGLRMTGGAWQEVTTVPYNAQPSNYTDPFWGNQGAGFSLVGGRTTALAQTPDGAWYAGTADGGVWRSTNQGGTWQPVFDSMPTLSIGALKVDPADGSLWVGTGEANTNADSYSGAGVYRAAPGSSHFQLVGGGDPSNNPLTSRTVYQLAFDPQGNAYAASNNGLFRYSASSGQWTEVLDPAGPVDNPPYDNQVTSVAVVPGTNGKQVIAVIGWRGGTTLANEANNGFYQSNDSGQTFQKVAPTGDINASDIGRTTFAYSSDGSKLYAVVESPHMLDTGQVSNLQGVFVANGAPASVAGPWTKIADAKKLSGSGSANAYGPDSVGAQSWYNQVLTVDPANANHVYLGLEEVFETTDGGTNWNTASPYWNYPFPCEQTNSCANTTHPDQHSQMIADGKIVIGNDGGVYSRPLSDNQQYGDWADLNSTLRSWQYYDARAGRAPSGGGVGVWGGLQDNGTSVLNAGSSQMDEPAGGDGFDVVVDPSNSNRAVGEYTDGTMYSTTDGGHSFYDPVSPGCVAQATIFPPNVPPMANCDPAMRFVTPLSQDLQNTNTWVTGGEYVWVTKAGWKTSCTSTASCSWQQVYDTGTNNAVTAVSSANNGRIIYAAFVSGGGNPGPSFSSGIATNYGGTWHKVTTSNLPNRFIAGVTVDPSDPAHAYAIFNGYSRRWIPGGGVGHVFETTNGGRSWQDISTNLPDIASDALVIQGNQLALATDLGMYTARAGLGYRTEWSRLGYGLPNASVNDVTPGPDGYIYAGTHGRGIWRLRLPGGGHGGR